VQLHRNAKLVPPADSRSMVSITRPRVRAAGSRRSCGAGTCCPPERRGRFADGSHEHSVADVRSRPSLRRAAGGPRRCCPTRLGESVLADDPCVQGHVSPCLAGAGVRKHWQVPRDAPRSSPARATARPNRRVAPSAALPCHRGSIGLRPVTRSVRPPSMPPLRPASVDGREKNL